MATTAGALSASNITDSQVALTSAAASGGTAPYTYQWYRSQTSGFSPGPSSIITGATALSFIDDGLNAGETYYYVVRATDSTSPSPVADDSDQLTVQMLASLPGQNQFNQDPILGMLDQRFNPDTVVAQFNSAGSGTLVAGQAVKGVTTAAGVLQVAPATLQADVIIGFVNYNIKNRSFAPGDYLEISMNQNVVYLYATAAISRYQQVVSKPAAIVGGCNGGVAPVTGSSGFPIVGWSMDTVSIGSLCRIFLSTPSFSVDS